MGALLAYLTLPKRVTGFEALYLRRLNRIALVFFYGHIPVLMLVAAVCGTHASRALLFSAVLLVGPTLAYFTFQNARHLSLVFGFTAMGMGGLLVHFGQGPMQIEMHFYFFVLIALLAVFANPLAIIAAAVTVALHHLILFAVFPRSVFNYDATYWAVAVHALFVVLEAAAACFVARSFFDNVIGLERIVEARTQDLRLVLDTVGQGLVTLNPDGTLSPVRSAAVDRWLGSHPPARPIWEVLDSIQAGVGAWFKVGWDEVWADVMPLDVALEQLPQELCAGNTIYALGYKPIRVDGQLQQVLLVISDVTTQRASEAAQAIQREQMEVFVRLTRDRRGFAGFFAEARTLAEGVFGSSAASREDTLRAVHTLKGNAAMFGITSLVNVCHATEAAMLEETRGLQDAERNSLRSAWQHFASRVEPLLGSQGSNLEITEADHAQLLNAILSGTSREHLARLVQSWKHEATKQRLDRLAVATRALAHRLSKGDVRVETESNGLRLEERVWAPLWGVLIHLLRNAVDHGLEAPAERRALGKPDAGTIRLRTDVVDSRFVIEVSDDGRGIQWHQVAATARKTGVQVETHEQLMGALFRGGISTKTTITEYSGRGIGLSAVKAACENLGGTFFVDSLAGRGTRFELSWPRSVLFGDGPGPNSGVTGPDLLA